MSQPPAYNREADFTKNHGSVQNDSLLNSELDDVSQSINALRERQALLLKDDDTLVNNIVTKDSLTASLQDSFNQIAVAVSTADEAKTIASEANATASEAKTIASEANATASEANATAQNAETHALAVEKALNETVADIEELTKAASSAAETAETAANNAAESASDAKTEASAASTTASTALENANTALSKGLDAVTKAQTAVDTVEELQTNLPSQVETEVAKQVDDAFEEKVTAAVEKTVPAIVEKTAASKDYVDSAVNTLDGELATVAKSGSYNDLSNKPTIPTVPSNVSAFTNDAGYLTSDSELNISKLSNQSGNANKFLTTDGTSASWASVPTRNIGEIVQSAVPLTDAGLHLMDGSLLASGGVYDAFISYISGLQSSYPDLFCTETEWQTSVSTYGSCGKFVYSSSGVRLPKVSDILQGTTDTSAVGDLIEAGLPNITGSFGVTTPQNHAKYADGAFSNATIADSTSDKVVGSVVDGTVFGYTFDASRSSSIYGNSTTVQQQAIKALFYICVATTTKTDIEVDIDNVVTELNGKADVGLSNLTVQAEVVSESGTDYIRYSSGLQICWGRWDEVTTAAGEYTNKVFSYAKEFSEVPSVYVTFNTDSIAGAFGKCSCSVTDVTATSCDVRFFNGDTEIRMPNLVILAIGWWK